MKIRKTFNYFYMCIFWDIFVKYGGMLGILIGLMIDDGNLFMTGFALTFIWWFGQIPTWMGNYIRRYDSKNA